MRTLRLAIISIIIISSCHSILFTQWTRTSGPMGANVTATTAFGQIVYAGTAEGDIYVSSDHGTNWALRNTGLPLNETVNCLYIHSGIIYAGFYGLFYSTDNGLSWHTRNALWTSSVRTLLYSGGYLFAGTYGSGLFRSTDDGITWSSTSTGLPPGCNIFSMLDKGGLLFASTTDSVYISTNLGSSWTSSSYASNRAQAWSLITRGGKVFAGTGNGIYKSTNNGQTWVYSSNGLPEFPGLVTLSTDSANIIASYNNAGIFKSSDDGNSWIPINTGFPFLYSHFPFITSVTIYNGNTYAASLYKGVWKSTNLGGQWSLSSNGMAGVTSGPLYLYNNNLYAGAFFNGLSMTSNFGDTWEYLGTNQYGPFAIAAVIRTDLNTIVGNQQGIYLTSNNGNNWMLVDSGINVGSFASINNIIFAQAGTDLIKSTNNGYSWIDANPNNYVVRGLYRNSAYLYMLSDVVLRSDDLGQSWHNIGLSGRELLTMAFSSSKIYVGTLGDGIFTTSNQGTDWFPAGLDSGFSVYSICATDSIVFALGGGNIYYSGNEGQNWSRLLTAYQGIFSPNNVLIANGFLFCATDRSVWKRSLSSIIGVRPISNDVPQEYNLSQNYPNPFNPSCKIRYSIPRSQMVKLTIYDILGKEIRTEINQFQQAGTYEAEFIGTDLPSGTYFYKLEAGHYAETKKMVLIK